MLELYAAIAEMYPKSHHGLFSNVKDTNKMSENLEFLHLGIFTEQFVYPEWTLCKSQHVQTAKNRSEKL